MLLKKHFHERRNDPLSKPWPRPERLCHQDNLSTNVTNNVAEVTCKKCLRILHKADLRRKQLAQTSGGKS